MRVAVVGAGIAGLACAYELHKLGLQVVVFEKESQIGGRARTRATPYQPFDTGAQFLANVYCETTRLCAELELKDPWRVLKPRTHHIFYQGQLRGGEYNRPMDLFKLKHLSLWSRLRLIPFLLRLRYLSRGASLFLWDADPVLDTQNTYDFAKKWAGQQVADYVIDALTTTYSFHGAKELSLAFFAGLGSVWKDEIIHECTPGGIDQLARELAKRVTVHTNSQVEAVDHTRLVIAGKTHTFDAVVCAVPAPHALRLLRNADSRVTDFLQGVEYSASIHCAYACPAEPIKHISLGIVPKEESDTIVGYINQASKYTDGPSGQSLMSVFVRDQTARQWMGRSDAEIFQETKAHFLPVCPPLQGQEMQPVDIQRWPEAIPKYSVGSMTKAKRFMAECQGLKGLFFAGDYLNAPWIEGSLLRGRKVAQKVQAAI